MSLLTLQKQVYTILNFIVEFQRENTFTPTVRQISAACGISNTQVVMLMSIMEARGYIERVPKDAPRRQRYRLKLGEKRTGI